MLPTHSEMPQSGALLVVREASEGTFALICQDSSLTHLSCVAIFPPEKALEFGRLGSCLTSTTYWLCSHAQNCLSMPQFPRLKNGRNNTVALLVIASAVIVSCHSPGGVSDRSLFFHSSGG